MRRLFLLVSTLLILFGCAVVVAGLYFFGILFPSRVPFVNNPTPVAVMTGVPAPTVVIPPVAATSSPEVSNSTLDELLNLDAPRNDPLQIVPRLKKTSGNFATPITPVIYQIGDKASFWVSRDITGTNQLVTATLHYITPHAYVWLEDGESASDDQLKAAGDAFENKVYPTDREYLGSEASPGIDNDPHVYILNTYFQGGAIGYISIADEYPPFVNRFSNPHEIFYMNVHQLRPGTESYTAVMAHEFAHLIHEHQNPREGSWVTEGLGDLAMKLNGFPQDVSSFVRNPDVQLNAWGELPSVAIPHYETAYLFLSYCLNRFGIDFIRDVVSSGTHDIFSVQKALDKRAPGLKFDDLFADWVVANVVNDRALGPRYTYLDRSLGIRPDFAVTQYPTKRESNVDQYAAGYIQLQPSGHDVTFTFDGATQVKAIPTDPHSGKMMWWGNRVDNSDTTLTRPFDLTTVQKATLTFWTWYDIEANFDYGYVEVSADGGKTWDTLTGTTTTTSDPNGANYGNGLTCRSGQGCDRNSLPAQWVQEQMDLTPFAGKNILLRFEYITDGIYAAPGLVIDDISIPEINFRDETEQGGNGWQAQGFARIDNVLRQRFIVQAVEFGSTPEATKVVPIPLDQMNHGTFVTSGFGRDMSHIIIVVLGNTPITWETASYSFTVQ
jgi:immune inhibitor A